MRFDLRKPDLTLCEEGDIVITTKGYEFLCAHVEGRSTGDPKFTWKDLQTGIRWLPHVPQAYQLASIDELFGEMLPTEREFKEAEEHGFRELLTDMNHLFWTATDNGFGFRSIFNGIKGNFFTGNENLQDVYLRLIERTKAPGN